MENLAEVTIIIRCGKSKTIHIITDKKTILGRSQDADIPLPDGSCSGKHCELYLFNGRLFINDLDSKNGTYVDGKKIGRQMVYLDDTIALGKTQINIDDSSIPMPLRVKWRRPSSRIKDDMTLPGFKLSLEDGTRTRTRTNKKSGGKHHGADDLSFTQKKRKK